MIGNKKWESTAGSKQWVKLIHIKYKILVTRHGVKSRKVTEQLDCCHSATVSDSKRDKRLSNQSEMNTLRTLADIPSNMSCEQYPWNQRSSLKYPVVHTATAYSRTSMGNTYALAGEILYFFWFKTLERKTPVKSNSNCEKVFLVLWRSVEIDSSYALHFTIIQSFPPLEKKLAAYKTGCQSTGISAILC